MKFRDWKEHYLIVDLKIFGGYLSTNLILSLFFVKVALKNSKVWAHNCVLSPVQTDATLLDVTCCVRFHTLLHVVAQGLKPVKLFSQQLPTFLLFRDRRSVAQQCWICLHSSSNIAGSTQAHYAWFTKTYGLYPSHDALQVPTLLVVVAYVCIPLPTRTQPYPAAYTFLSFEIAEVCLPLANWRLHKRHYLIINDWVAKTFQQRPGSSKFACIKFIIQFTHKLKPPFYRVSKFLFTDHCKTTHSRRQHATST